MLVVTQSPTKKEQNATGVKTNNVGIEAIALRVFEAEVRFSFRKCVSYRRTNRLI